MRKSSSAGTLTKMQNTWKLSTNHCRRLLVSSLGSCRTGGRTTEGTIVKKAMDETEVAETTAGTEEAGSGRIDAVAIVTTVAVTGGTGGAMMTTGRGNETTHINRGPEETTNFLVWL